MGLKQIAGVTLLFPCQANSVFVRLSHELEEGLKNKGWVVTVMPGGTARFTCSWDTQPEDIDALLSDLHSL